MIIRALTHLVSRPVENLCGLAHRQTGKTSRTLSLMVVELPANDWYYAVECHACGRRIPFSRVRANIPTDPIEVSCMECFKASDYSPIEFERVHEISLCQQP